MNDINPGHCIIPKRPSEIGAIWTFTVKSDAVRWRNHLRSESPEQRVRIVERTLSVFGTSTPIFCLVIGG